MPTDAVTSTILFTDLVGSTEVLQRVGDEAGQRAFRTHHALLREAALTHNGEEVKWLGDGLMVAFDSARDAIRCAEAMVRASRLPAAGQRLSIRVGLNSGEVLRDEADYFGSTVVIARRLCDRASAGQILCSGLVAGLLAGQKEFRFRDLGMLDLKGISTPIQAFEVLPVRSEEAAIPVRTPFVGRSSELSRLMTRLAEARSGVGGLVMLAGEPGIGKTRMAEELAEAARQTGALVLWGRCFEGEWAPPFGPFAEAISGYARQTEAEQAAQDLGYGAAPILRLVPELRELLPTVPEPEPLQPGEERVRILDAVSQFLITLSERTPVLLVIDDLHWADAGSLAMLRHVARFARQHRLLILGAYRDIELDRQHPLSEALSQLRREAEYERIALKGLAGPEVAELLAAVSEQDAPVPFAEVLSQETSGNPFFIRETLLHLVEEDLLYNADGQWRTDISIEELGIPEGVRQVISRRLSRLSEDANKLLTAGSAFDRGFRFDVVAKVASVPEDRALDALDEALDAGVIRPAEEQDTYSFTHALIRHTLYGELNPSRRVRLHRQVADAMEELLGRQAAEHAAELGYQYYQSAVLPGSEQGADHCLAAAARAESAYAHEQAANFLRMALELLPEDDPRRVSATAQLGLTLPLVAEPAEAVDAIRSATAMLLETKGKDAAADYLAQSVSRLAVAGYWIEAQSLAAQGLTYAGDRRDPTWAQLMQWELARREAEMADAVGVPVEWPEVADLRKIFHSVPPSSVPYFLFRVFCNSREELAHEFGDNAAIQVFWLGEYESGRQGQIERAEECERIGLIDEAAVSFAGAARASVTLGDFAEAERLAARAQQLSDRLSGAGNAPLVLAAYRFDREFVLDQDWPAFLGTVTDLAGGIPEQHLWAAGGIRAGLAAVLARLGKIDESMNNLESVIPALERGHGTSANYMIIAFQAAQTLWLLNRTDHAAVIEQNILEKIVAPDFHYPMSDARLALGWLSALQGRPEDAAIWFQRAREVTEEIGARPLRAVTDHDEALALIRAGSGDQTRIERLLESALAQFRALGMPGWELRTLQLLGNLSTGKAAR